MIDLWGKECHGIGEGGVSGIFPLEWKPYYVVIGRDEDEEKGDGR